MGKILRLAIVVAVAFIFSARGAKADTLTYDLTGPYGIDITFNLPQSPSFTSRSFGYIVPVSGLNIYGTPITTLDFFNSSRGGGLGFNGSTQLTGSQLYTFTSGSLNLSLGNFTLNDYGANFNLSVASDPTSTTEPATLFMLAAGLAGLWWARKRQPAGEVGTRLAQ